MNDKTDSNDVATEMPYANMPISFQSRLAASVIASAKAEGVTQEDVANVLTRFNQYMIQAVLVEAWVDGEVEAVGMKDGEVIFVGKAHIPLKVKAQIADMTKALNEAADQAS